MANLVGLCITCIEQRTELCFIYITISKSCISAHFHKLIYREKTIYHKGVLGQPGLLPTYFR